MKLTWIAQSGYCIESEDGIVYIDPVAITQPLPPADIVFLTHSHKDHFAITDLAKICTAHTIIVATEDITQTELSQLNFAELIQVKPNEMGLAGFVSYTTTPAYNLDKPFHPRTQNWVGYVLIIAQKRFYFTGDCDAIPELLEQTNLDYCILPVSGIYVMNAQEASDIAKKIDAKTCIPCHYEYVVGSEADALAFTTKTKNAIILSPFVAITLKN